MKKNISLYYYNEVNNFGDLLNEVLINELFDCNIRFESLYKCELVAIGSLLESFLHGSNNLKLITKKAILPTLNIWGTGFISDEDTRIMRPNKQQEIFFRKTKIHALRGEFTKRRIEKMLSKQIDSPIGDPGLLASKLIPYSKIQKKFRLGIIPHYVDANNIKIKDITTSFSDAHVINILESPISVLNKIAQCETIISSAMHGLIAADSMGIPNARLILSDKITGGNFKYNDYYSAFKIKNHNNIDFRNSKIDVGKIKLIINEYNVPFNKVMEIQELLINSFPFLKN
jgi:hypothetical protein